MIIGLATIKPYKKVNEQFIGTQFVILGIPLIPIQSFFFVDGFGNRGLEMGMFTNHVIKIYAGVVAFIGSILLAIPDVTDLDLALRLLLIVLLVGGAILLMLKFDRMDDAEKEMRTLIGDIVGINALPEYLEYDALITVRNKFIITLQGMLGTKEYWADIVKAGSFDDKVVPLMFVIAKYENQIKPNIQNRKLMEELYKRTLELRKAA